MWVILLEALAALLLLIALVWWTMFSGRKGGERLSQPEPAPPDDRAAPGAGEPGTAPSGSGGEPRA